MTEPHLLKRLLVLLHTVVIIIGTVISTFIFAVLAILVSFFSKNGDGVHQVARVWGRSIRSTCAIIKAISIFRYC
jgi:hypothetical protein